MIAFSDLTALPVVPADFKIAYGSQTVQFGELRLPAGSDIVPVVVLIHGGCWRAQYDLKHVAAAAAAIAKEGFAVWTIEYSRLGDPAGGWPGTFDDVAKAVDHIRVISSQHPRVDSNRVILMGHSAGGQLALWVASRRQNEATGLFRSAQAPLKIMGVVSLAGITDLAAYGATPGGCNSAVTPLLGGTPQLASGRYRAVSPREHLPIGAPVRLIHGEADAIVPLAQSSDFIAHLRAAGDISKLDVVPGAGHFDLVAPQSEAWPTVMRAIRALASRATTATPMHAPLQ